MKINEITVHPRRRQVVTEAAKGRDLNHLEDLIFFDGAAGARRSVDILRSLETNEKDLSIKWDGKLALYYGRLPSGQFALGTMGNWNKNEPKTSARDIYSYITTAGKGEEWRGSMAQALAQCFDLLDASVPTSFKGFVKGDVLFAPAMAPVRRENGRLVFTSGQVTYSVDPVSDIGNRVAEATIGIALHATYSEWGSKDASIISSSLIPDFNTSEVLVLGQTYAQIKPRVDARHLDKVDSEIKKWASQIDSVLPTRPGLADMAAILYRYQNQTARAGQLDRIGWPHFVKWLETSNVSQPKQVKIKSINDEIPGVFAAIFGIVNNLRLVKNDVIQQLDQANQDIQASTNGEPSGEGYVSTSSSTKLVPRHIWKPH